MKSLLTLLAFLPTLVFAQTGKKMIELSGNIRGLTGRSTVYIANVNTPTDTIAKTVKTDATITND